MSVPPHTFCASLDLAARWLIQAGAPGFLCGLSDGLSLQLSVTLGSIPSSSFFKILSVLKLNLLKSSVPGRSVSPNWWMLENISLTYPFSSPNRTDGSKEQNKNTPNTTWDMDNIEHCTSQQGS